MSYRTTRKADEDIIGIYVYAIQELAEQAERYHKGLIRTFGILAANPDLAREHMELAPPVRIHPYGSHLIIYTLQENGVLFVRVLHGRQDWERYI